MFAPNVNIVDSDFHSIQPFGQRLKNPGFENDSSVLIGDNVWIGMNVTILKGVKIGNNSVIGACSLVLNDIEDNVLAAGIPAEPKKLLS